MQVTILGSGSSAGVPRIGNNWGACDPSNPRNRRRRCSLLVEQSNGEGTTRVLVDTSPDLREQLLDADVGELDGVLYTHDHADQTHGIDDLRLVAINMMQRVSVFADATTRRTLEARFGYCFVQQEGSLYPPILDLKDLPPSGETISIKGDGGQVDAVPFRQNHGPIDSLGFRFGGLAYSSDVVGLPEESFDILKGVEVWIVDALRYKPHPTHAHLDMTLSWIERIKPKRSILTNLHIDMDYETLQQELPSGVEPAYDGMRIEFAA